MSTPAFLDAGPDADVIAGQVVKSKKSKGQPVPSVVDLATAIADIQIEDTIHGSSTLTLTVADPDWTLLDSGFFDANKDGRLDAIDVRYPEGSRFWWRLTQVRIGAGVIEMVFMERAAAHLISHRGPVKVSRAKKTRAEFLAMLAAKVKAGGGIKFVCREMKTKQAQAPEDKPKPKDADERKEQKEPGIAKGEDLTIKGAKATAEQLKNVEIALDVAKDLEAPERAVIAMLCAGIGESNFRAIMNTAGSPYGGVFQGNVRNGTWDKNDTAGMAKSFLLGGKGFQAGGAIALAKAGVDPGEIATRVEASGKPGSFYGAYKAEAEKLLEAYGGGDIISSGGASNSGTYRKQYNFEVGSPEEPRETYWDAMNRLAEEVKWPLFFDGQNLYFDSETTLIKQKPVAVINRDDAAVITWDVTWDARNIATEFSLELICDPFEFRAGEVFKLNGFGPASTGSTAKLPGRWLISEIGRSRFSLASSFTLKQPEKPDPEPRSEEVERGGDDDASGDAAGTGKLYDECKRLSDATPGYLYGGGHGTPLSSLSSSDRLDCSSSSSLALKRAGMFPGGVAIVSGAFASSWGKAGRGSDFTVWANGGHVFIQSEGSGNKWRFDTGGPGGGKGPKVHANHRPTGGFTPRHWTSSSQRGPQGLPG